MFYYKLTYSVNPYFLGVLSNKIVLNAEVSYTRFFSLKVKSRDALKWWL